jgi:hypothetical protein
MNGCDKNRRDNNNPDLRQKVLKKSKTKERSLNPSQCLSQLGDLSFTISEDEAELMRKLIIMGLPYAMPDLPRSDKKISGEKHACRCARGHSLQ